ncbi:AAA family ATPase [soil metagenome]
MNDLLTKALLALLSNRPKPIFDVLKDHFGRNPRKNAIVQAQYSCSRQTCINRALNHIVGTRRRHGSVVGIASTDYELSFGDLIHPDNFDQQTVGPLQYKDVLLSDGTNLSCPEKALYLINDGTNKFAAYLYHPRYEDHIVLEVMAKDKRAAQDFLHRVALEADLQSIYKGQVVTLKEGKRQEVTFQFHNVPKITREQLILQPEVIDEIERHTAGFSKHKELLVSRGRHLKRGLLLYGPPGTGKSLTIMYLLTAMPGRTAIVLSGNSVKHLEDACALARGLQPATVIIDDVDLVAQDRTAKNYNPLLFELMNQMDGLADDADVLFLLTTNKPEILEPALASRPGRIDLAVLIPLPDKECRRRLFELYSQGLPLAVSDMNKFIESTDGVSAAYIRELFRKATLFAAEEGAEVSICDKHIEAASKLLSSTDKMTDKLLGGNMKGTED